jgi:Tol biopolymer transport system component
MRVFRQTMAGALGMLTAILSACGGESSSIAPPPLTTGTLEFNVVTTGTDINVDGFVMDVDGQSRILPANGTVSFSALPGTHQLTSSGFAFNCDLIAAPTSANVVLATTTRLDLQATCTPYLSNAILFTTTLYGVPEVMAMRPDGSRRIRLTTDLSGYLAPAVSPDGQSIAVASGPLGGPRDGIYLLDRFGKGRTKLVGRSDFDGMPAWSPDGTKLAFRSAIHTLSGDRDRIFIVNRDGTGLRQLTPESTDPNLNIFDEAPSWSPDGSRLLFERSAELSFINADGTGLVSTGVIGDNPSWSRDGTQIAYQGLYVFGSAGHDGIFVMDMTFTPHRLMTAGLDDQMPRWSPDGTQLVFARVESGLFHLYKMQADGSDLTPLSPATLSEIWPSWSPKF